MKKIFLFLFLLAIVSTKTLVLSNSLSPPQSTVAMLMPQLPMLQMPIAEMPQLDVCFFERDAPCLVWFENLQSILPDVSVGQTANFQVLNNPNYSRNFFGKSNVILQAMSPNCRTVIASDLFQNVVVISHRYYVEAISPKCRTVLTVLRS